MAATSETPASQLTCEVRQTHDHALMQRAFNAMSNDACDFLWEDLQIDSRYEQGELPERHTPTGRQLLWHELLKAGHLTGGAFFVVYDLRSGECEPIFLSVDWASAQNFTQTQIASDSREEVHAVPSPLPEVSPSFGKKPVVMVRDDD